jgi:hypothetical protein
VTASNGFDVAALFAAAARANPDLIPRAALEVSREAFQRGRSRLPLSVRRERAARRLRCRRGHFVIYGEDCSAPVCIHYI